MMDTDEFVSVHTLTNRFESDILVDALEQENIPAIVRTFEETPYDGLFISQRGWGRILVPREYTSRAREIIEALLPEGGEEKDGERERGNQGEGIYQDPEEIDPNLWKKLEQADPAEICRNSLASYDAGLKAYTVAFLKSQFLIVPAERRIQPLDPESPHKLSFQFYLFMLHYLLEAVPQPISGKWVSEKELPGGRFFFRGPHALPVDQLLEHFGTRLDAFRAAAKALNGTPMDAGDVAYRFEVLPRVPLAVILWEGDDEFKPAMHMHFDQTVSLHLRALDIIFAMVNVVAASLVRSARKQQLI